MGSVMDSVFDAGMSVVPGNVGGKVSDKLGLYNNYQASNPYDKQVLADELARRAEIYNQQQALAQLLQENAAGRGPNPAQTQYLQNVNRNIANTQGLISSQRGLNPALAARMGANAGALANQQAASQASLLQQNQQLGAMAGLGGLYGQMQQGNMQQQQLYTGANEAAQRANAAVAAGNQQARSQLIGGMLSGAGAAMGMAHGGEVPQMGAQSSGPLSMAARHLMMAQGGSVPAMNMVSGGGVPGQARHAGDNLKNDTVPAMLSPGEIVIPRSVVQSEDAPNKARAFVEAILARSNGLRR